MTEAERQCRAERLPFSEIFRYQYLISRQQVAITGMARRRFGRFHLYIGQALPVTELLDCEGAPIGLLLGVAVAPEGALGASHMVPRLSARSDDCLDEFESWLIDLAGRYTIVLDMADEQRVYCDPVGMNGVVYNPQTRRVASSPLLCIDREVMPNPLYDFDALREHGGRFTLFTTIDAEVTRMNPNFYLDLANFHETRHWPREEVFEHSPKDYGRAVDQIIKITRHNIGALATAHDCVMPLSAGRDSRLLLAMAGPHRDKISQFFTHVTNAGTRRDAEVARDISQKLGVPHEVHMRRPMRRPRDIQRAERNQRAFQIAAGVVTSAPNEMSLGVQAMIRPGAVVLRGHQTDLLRAVYVSWTNKAKWKDFHWQMRKLFPVPIEHFTTEVANRFRPLFTNWLQTLPRNALEKQPDFMFLEVFYSASLGSGFPANWHCFYLSPFNSRRLMTLALGFDDAYRLSGRTVDDVLFRIDPDLAAIPFGLEWSPDAEVYPLAQSRVEEAEQRHGELFPQKHLRKAG